MRSGPCCGALPLCCVVLVLVVVVMVVGREEGLVWCGVLCNVVC